MNSKFSIDKFCTHCGDKLTDINWNDYDKRVRNYECKKCIYLDEKKHSIYINREGKQISLRGLRRESPKDGLCELCHTRPYHPYHHWDDLNINKGLYLCGICHQIAEGVDKGKHLTYLELKNSINLEK